MSYSLRSQLRYAGLTSLLFQAVVAVVPLQAACYNTPRAAIDALETASSASVASKNTGFRVTRIQPDPVLGQRWAMIASCDHPEWPAFALPAGMSSRKTSEGVERLLSDSVKMTPVVRAGDIVRMWRQEGFTRIAVAGVSEENGGLGKTIRVRLLRSNTDDQSIPEQFSGVVRGPLNVEIQP